MATDTSPLVETFTCPFTGSDSVGHVTEILKEIHTEFNSQLNHQMKQ